MKRFLENIYISVFIVSVITTHIYMNLFGLGFAAIEIGLVPIIIALWRKYTFFTSRDFVFVIVLIVVLTTLSLINLNSEQFKTIWKVIRSYLLFFLAFFFFYRNKFTDWERIFSISCLSILFDIVSSLLHVRTNIAKTDGEFAMLINILLPVFTIGYSYLKKSRFQYILVCLLCVLDAFFSITRGNLLYVLLAIFLSLLILDSKRTIKNALLFGIIGIIVIGTYFRLENTILNYSPSIHYRLYTKVLHPEDASTGDAVREGHLLYLIEHFDYCFIPHGFPSRESRLVSKEDERLMWSVRDCSINELVYTFGGLGYLIPFLLLFGARNLYKKETDDSMNKIFCLCFLVIDGYLFTGYGLLSTPSTVLYLGIIMGASYRIIHLKRT